MNNKEKLEQKILTWVPLFTAVAMAFIALIRLWQQEFAIAALDGIASIILTIVGVNALKGKKQRFAGIAVMSIFIGTLLFSIYVKGYEQIIWYYPLLPVLFYFITPKKATIYALIVGGICLTMVINNISVFIATSTTISMLITIACSFAFGYLNEQHHQELVKTSLTDHLTELGNRRLFNDTLDKLTNKAADDLYLILLDLDHFKSINDTYGHSTGDEVLTQTANLIKSTLNHDKFFRIGGEEFAIIQAKTSEKETSSIAENIRKVVEQHQFIEGKTVTVSMGAGKYDAAECIAAWYRRTDSALYQAKANGRNQTVLA